MVREDDGCSDRAYPIGRYIANLLGGIFVPMPQSHKSMDSGVIKNISSVLKETGDAVEVTRKVWFDETPGRISNKERAACVAEIDEAMARYRMNDGSIRRRAKAKQKNGEGKYFKAFRPAKEILIDQASADEWFYGTTKRV